MSKLILNHPQKMLIDSVLLQNISSREKAKLLAEKHGIKISHSVLAKYHTEYLGGEIDIDADAEHADAEHAPTQKQPYYIVVKNGVGYEILYNSAIINSSKNDIILARVQRKIYTKDRVNSNLTAAKNKAKKGEPTAPARVQFWGEIKTEIELYNSVVNAKKHE